MPLKVEVLDRLLLSKSFLEKIRYQPVASHDRHTLAANIIAAHDAAELAIAAICDQLGCLPQRGVSYLMDYFGSFKDARSVDVHAREYFRNLNAARNLLKHQGLFPDARQWARVGETVFQHVTKWCWDYLTESFTELDESALLLNADVKRLYDQAKQAASQKDYKAALESLAFALAIVFAENAALRGFEAGNSNAEDAIRALGFGIHGNDFLALQEFLPHVPSWGAHANALEWQQSGFGHPGNWHENSVRFCLRTFVDVAVKLQGAQWIPRAFSRDVLYDHQIEVIRDGVEFWRFVPDTDDTKVNYARDGFTLLGRKAKQEIKQLLPHKGDKLRATVRLATKPQNYSSGGFFGSEEKDETRLSLILIESFEFWEVRASDVKVTCVPKESKVVQERFGWLPEIEWEPE